MASTFVRMRELWGLLGTSQRVLFLSLAGAVLATLLIFFTWLGREQFTLLYSDLGHEESARVIEVLQKQNVEYRVTNGGSGLMVPASRVGELKVALAGEGLPTGGMNGYELFDDQGLGVSEFTQNLNFRRALEGELARSITTINGIAKARVHLVLPKAALFKSERQEPTASVVLNLARPGALRADQVEAIQRLVAGSVESLAPEQVTILDSFGTLLSRDGTNDVTGLSSAQLEIKEEVEVYLSRKAQTTLESVLGAGAALVRVNADLDFEKVERTREVVDPETSAVVNEQRSQSQREIDGETTESSTVEYQFNRMVENIVGATGGVRKLTVAVLIDGIYSQGPDGASQYAARSPQELEGYRKIVENIVGLDSERGDKIELLNVRFQENLPVATNGFGIWMEYGPQLLKGLLVVLALVFLMLTFRRLSGQLVAGLSTPGRSARVAERGGEPGRLLPGDRDAGAEIQGASTRALEMEEQARALALEKPEDIAQLVRTWMHARS